MEGGWPDERGCRANSELKTTSFAIQILHIYVCILFIINFKKRIKYNSSHYVNIQLAIFVMK